jgi:hypothetical protein
MVVIVLTGSGHVASRCNRCLGTVGAMELRPLTLLSLQQALLGMIVPELRSVEFWIEDRRVRAVFAYDGEVSEEHAEAVSEIETLVRADLPDHVEVRFEAISVPRSRAVGIVRDSAYAYLRRE